MIQPDLTDQALKTGATVGAGAGAALVFVDDEHLCRRPAELNGPLGQAYCAASIRGCARPVAGSIGARRPPRGVAGATPAPCRSTAGASTHVGERQLLIGVLLCRSRPAQALLHQLAQQRNQALALRRRQPAPIDRSLAAHAGRPAISQAPITPYIQVLAPFAQLSKSLLQRFL
jgi:hypothetical protein